MSPDSVSPSVDGVPEMPAERTGVRTVDEVIASVEDLQDRPLEEHASVFEAAHEGLRRALDPGEPDPH